MRILNLTNKNESSYSLLANCLYDQGRKLTKRCGKKLKMHAKVVPSMLVEEKQFPDYADPDQHNLLRRDNRYNWKIEKHIRTGSKQSKNTFMSRVRNAHNIQLIIYRASDTLFTVFQCLQHENILLAPLSPIGNPIKLQAEVFWKSVKTQNHELYKINNLTL